MGRKRNPAAHRSGNEPPKRSLTMDATTPYLSTLVALMAIMDPIGAVGIFIGITPGETEHHRRRQAARLPWGALFPARVLFRWKSYS